MKMRYLYTALLLALSCFAAKAQMWNGTDTLYGNEWIRYDRPYFKIATAEDGVLRIPYETLAAQGIPADANFRLFAMGREVPLYLSNPAGTPFLPAITSSFLVKKTAPNSIGTSIKIRIQNCSTPNTASSPTPLFIS